MNKSDFFVNFLVLFAVAFLGFYAGRIVSSEADPVIDPLPLRFVVCYSDFSICRDLKEVQDEPPVYDPETGKWW